MSTFQLQEPVPDDFAFAAIIPFLPKIVALISAALAATAIGEIVRGPVSQALSTIFPHADAAVRNLSAMYVAGSLSRDEFVNASSVKQLQEPDKTYIVRYADYLHDKHVNDLLESQRKVLIREMESMANTLDGAEAKAFDIELDPLEAAVKSLEADLVKDRVQETKDALDDEISLDEVLTGAYESKLKSQVTAEAKITLTPQRISRADFLALAEPPMIEYLSPELDANRFPVVPELQQAGFDGMLTAGLISVAQLNYAREQGYDTALLVRAGEMISGVLS